MHVLKDEDSDAMEVATEILLTLAFLHLGDRRRAEIAKEAAEALEFLTPTQSTAEMVSLALSTCMDTLEAKRVTFYQSAAPSRPQLAATRMRVNLEGSRPIVKSRSS